MTPKERYLTALRGGEPDKTPFVVYECMIPQCSVERALRERGMLIMHRTASYAIERPNCRRTERRYTDEQGRPCICVTIETPRGVLTALEEPAGFTTWTHEHLFKTPEDYKALLSYIEDARVIPRYGETARLEQQLGEDFTVRDAMPYEPLQEIIYHLMGVETFGIEWMDNRDEVMRLYNALNEVNRGIYGVVAEGPLGYANYGGNVTPQLIGPKVFRELYMPVYAEAAEALHKRGKLIGCHFDADNTIIMDDIARTPLNYIEAYDPGVGPSIAAARAAFKGKALSIHWPSGDQFLPYEGMVERTASMIREAGTGGGFIIGITEDTHPDRWQMLFTAIMDGIEMG